MGLPVYKLLSEGLGTKLKTILPVLLWLYLLSFGFGFSAIPYYNNKYNGPDKALRI